MTTFLAPPISPMRIEIDRISVSPAGPTLTRRLSDLDGLFADKRQWESDLAEDDRVVYTVMSTPVPEIPRELPQSITTIHPGNCGGEFYMTKGHQHPDPQAEIYLGLEGTGGLLLFDGEKAEYIEMAPGVLGYIPPHWAHRSINTGAEPYSVLAVYPGSAGHDYQWVLDHGMGNRVMATATGYRLVPFTVGSE